MYCKLCLNRGAGVRYFVLSIMATAPVGNFLFHSSEVTEVNLFLDGND